MIVSDIATDPLWAEYRELAEPFGLAACWSTPILGPEGQVLGSFAMYHDEPREPTASDLDLTLADGSTFTLTLARHDLGAGTLPANGLWLPTGRQERVDNTPLRTG